MMEGAALVFLILSKTISAFSFCTTYRNFLTLSHTLYFYAPTLPPTLPLDCYGAEIRFVYLLPSSLLFSADYDTFILCFLTFLIDSICSIMLHESSLRETVPPEGVTGRGTIEKPRVDSRARLRGVGESKYSIRSG